MSTVLSRLGRAPMQPLVARVPSQRPCLTRSTPALRQTRYFGATSRIRPQLPREAKVDDMASINKRTSNPVKLNKGSLHERRYCDWNENPLLYADSGVYRTKKSERLADATFIALCLGALVYWICSKPGPEAGASEEVQIDGSEADKSEPYTSDWNRPQYMNRALRSLKTCLWVSP